ncbi:MAG: S41 family peptidase [Chlorobi bacterium]|nr:S41 family peptidase [Chlorobiota bacterium]
MTDTGKRRNIWMPFIFALLIVSGIFIGRYFLSVQDNNTGNSLFIYPQTDKIETVLNLIKEEYVDTINMKELEEKVIPHIIENLDPHSVYIPAKDLAQVNEELEGNFGGIGVQFSIQDDTVIVVSVISGGPSEKVGILPGDRIIKVNDTLIAGVGITNNDVIHKLRGEMGTKVNVSIKRRNVKDLIDFEIIRGEIPITSVDVAYMINDSTGYIKIDRFAQNTYEEFITALAKLKEQKCKNIIVDLRNNSGGLLDQAYRITNEFLKKDELIFYTQGKAQPRREVRANGIGSCQNNKMIVLINEFSASASEIFAGAIQDNDRGLIVGRRSFGKGLVQSQIPLPDGSALRLTVARYYTPSGRCIQKPYKRGDAEDYYKDIMNRYEHGEFFQKDSIVPGDTVKYYTKSGRVVYGGGGIMPDVFVPRDTTQFSDFYYTVRASGLIYQFALKYADEHRKEMQDLKDADAILEYLNKKPILQEFISYVKSKKVKVDPGQVQRSKVIIDTELKAYIARNLIDNIGFYPIMQKVDNVLQVAIKEMNKKFPFEEDKQD